MQNPRSSAARMIAGLRDAALTLLYPNACRVCGAVIESWRDGVACAACWRAVESVWKDHSSCGKCGLSLPPLSAHLEIKDRRCGRCQELAFTRARSCGPYEGALRESVIWLKTHEHLAPRLYELLFAQFMSLDKAQAIETIIPVPLHPSRLKTRGFNQAEVLAKALSRATGLYLDTASLIRVKASDPQRAGMDAIARAKSVGEAFHVRAPRLIENRAVLLVDDVITTGATAHEIANTLLAGGARAVSVLTLARAASHLS
jgi:ComF family protein